jgi:hypothetical protein
VASAQRAGDNSTRLVHAVAADQFGRGQHGC